MTKLSLNPVSPRENEPSRVDGDEEHIRTSFVSSPCNLRKCATSCANRLWNKLSILLSQLDKQASRINNNRLLGSSDTFMRDEGNRARCRTQRVEVNQSNVSFSRIVLEARNEPLHTEIEEKVVSCRISCRSRCCRLIKRNAMRRFNARTTV